MATPAPEWPRRLLILGCGNMGGAMLTGWLRAGWSPNRFMVVDPMMAQGPKGVMLFPKLPKNLGADVDAVLLGVKPQLLDEVAPALNKWLKTRPGDRKVILSLLAGVELETLRRVIYSAGAHVRIMPNLAAAIGKAPMGVVGQWLGPQNDYQQQISALLAPLGTAEWFSHEGPMDAITALVGSGPAFVYRFLDALAQGGAQIGLPADQALRLALSMVEGAAALAAASDVPPAELARRVASPGGTTEAGLKVLDEGEAITRLMAATLKAARDRSEEMAAAARAG